MTSLQFTQFSFAGSQSLLEEVTSGGVTTMQHQLSRFTSFSSTSSSLSFSSQLASCRIIPSQRKVLLVIKLQLVREKHCQLQKNIANYRIAIRYQFTTLTLGYHESCATSDELSLVKELTHTCSEKALLHVFIELQLVIQKRHCWLEKKHCQLESASQ